MRELLNKSYDKFEAKKRSTLGDLAFLTKYTKSYPRNIKILRILTPIVVIASFLTMVVFILDYNKDATNYNLIFAIIWGVIGAIWTFTTIRYYLFDFKIMNERVQRWNAELAEINKQNNSELQG